MNRAFKHYARIKNVNRSCVVVFRQIPDGRGRIVDTDNCLVIDLESLPDKYRAEIERIVSSEMGQRSINIYEVFKNERFSFNGENVMQWFSNPDNNRMQKVSVYNVAMKPNQNTEIDLWEVNVAVEMNDRGANREEIQRRIAEMKREREMEASRKSGAAPAAQPLTPFGDSPAQAPAQAAPAAEAAPQKDPMSISPFQAVGNEPLQDVDVAAKFRADAERYMTEARELIKKADELDPQSASPHEQAEPVAANPLVHEDPIQVPDQGAGITIGGAQDEALASLAGITEHDSAPAEPAPADASAKKDDGVVVEW